MSSLVSSTPNATIVIIGLFTPRRYIMRLHLAIMHRRVDLTCLRVESTLPRVIAISATGLLFFGFGDLFVFFHYVFMFMLVLFPYKCLDIIECYFKDHAPICVVE